MSNQTSNPPADTIRDGAISAKVWRNLTKENEPFYSVTFQRTYSDPRTGEPRDSASFQGTDVLKIQELASRAYQSVNLLREADRQQGQEQTQHQEPQDKGMAAQRDAAMQNAPAQEPQQQPARSHER